MYAYIKIIGCGLNLRKNNIIQNDEAADEAVADN